MVMGGRTVYPGSVGTNGVLTDGHDVLQFLVAFTLLFHEGKEDVFGGEMVVVLFHVCDESGIEGTAVFDAVVEVIAAPSYGGASSHNLFITLPSVLDLCSLLGLQLGYFLCEAFHLLGIRLPLLLQNLQLVTITLQLLLGVEQFLAFFLAALVQDNDDNGDD